MTNVTITKGQYRDIAIANQTFELVKAPKSGKKGMFVTVNAEGHANLPARNIRITVESAEMVRNTDEKPSDTVEPTETDEQTSTYTYDAKTVQIFYTPCFF